MRHLLMGLVLAVVMALMAWGFYLLNVTLGNAFHNHDIGVIVQIIAGIWMVSIWIWFASMCAMFLAYFAETGRYRGRR